MREQIAARNHNKIHGPTVWAVAEPKSQVNTKHLQSKPVKKTKEGKQNKEHTKTFLFKLTKIVQIFYLFCFIIICIWAEKSVAR